MYSSSRRSTKPMRFALVDAVSPSAPTTATDSSSSTISSSFRSGLLRSARIFTRLRWHARHTSSAGVRRSSCTTSNCALTSSIEIARVCCGVCAFSSSAVTSDTC
eukprot:Mycagemm_TRINITY_DN10079_c0_g1::TRINITY_DN10079_c0_g1_i1::g.2201::m.2201 type:complete len:105 gc:universal TRINITY_DN10079_c0_g1_i1:445-131(-)